MDRKRITPWRSKNSEKVMRDPLRHGDFYLLKDDKDLLKYPDLLDRLNIKDIEED